MHHSPPHNQSVIPRSRRLGSPEQYVRIDAVYALELVLRDSPEHHDDIVNVLVAFVRAHTQPAADSPVPQAGTIEQATDTVNPNHVQAAPTVLGPPPASSYRQRRGEDGFASVSDVVDDPAERTADAAFRVGPAEFVARFLGGGPGCR